MVTYNLKVIEKGMDCKFFSSIVQTSTFNDRQPVRPCVTYFSAAVAPKALQDFAQRSVGILWLMMRPEIFD